MAGTGASGHLLGHRDTDDLEGRLDVRRVVVTRDEEMLDVVVKTYERLRARDFQTGDSFEVQFDSRRGPRRDFSLSLNYHHGPAYCELYDRRGFSVGSGSAERGRRSFSCRITRADLRPTEHVRWRVMAHSGQGVDTAPRRGWYAH